MRPSAIYSSPDSWGAAAILAVAISLTATATRAAEVSTEHLFGFTTGSDVGVVGEKEIEAETVGRLGKRAGSYSALSSIVAAEFTPVENFRITPGFGLSHHNISSVPDLTDRRSSAFDGLSLEMRYRLLNREHAPFGLTVGINPRWNRTDDVSGQPADRYGADLVVAADKELVANTIYAAANVFYQPETTRLRMTGEWHRDATIGLSSALMMQIRPDIFVGGDARYLRHNEGLGFDKFAGHALYIGPMLYARPSSQSWVSLAWETQVDGRSTTEPGSLDLKNFERQQLRFSFGFNF